MLQPWLVSAGNEGQVERTYLLENTDGQTSVGPTCVSSRGVVSRPGVQGQVTLPEWKRHVRGRGVVSKRGKRESERGMEAGQLLLHTHSRNNGDDRWARMDGLSTGGMLTERIASGEGEQKKGEAKKVKRRRNDVSLCHFRLCIFMHLIPWPLAGIQPFHFAKHHRLSSLTKLCCHHCHLSDNLTHSQRKLLRCQLPAAADPRLTASNVRQWRQCWQ